MVLDAGRSADSPGLAKQADEHDVLAGRAGGQIQSGRHIVYPKSTPLADLYLSTLRMMGVKADSFADAQGPLAGLGDANFTGQYGFQQIDGR